MMAHSAMAPRQGGPTRAAVGGAIDGSAALGEDEVATGGAAVADGQPDPVGVGAARSAAGEFGPCAAAVDGLVDAVETHVDVKRIGVGRIDHGIRDPAGANRSPRGAAIDRAFEPAF